MKPDFVIAYDGHISYSQTYMPVIKKRICKTLNDWNDKFVELSRK